MKAGSAVSSGERTRARRLRLHRFGLRSRVAAAYSAVALLVSLTAALVVWLVSSGFLIEQREDTVRRQALAGAQVLQRAAAPARLPGLQSQVDDRAQFYGSAILVQRGNTTLAGAELTPDAVPPALRELVDSGVPARQRLRIDGAPVLLVGIPLADDIRYYEAAPLAELDSALRYLSAALAVGSLLAVLVTLVFGWSAARRALRPVAELTATAEAVAAGDLAARMSTRDPDLAPIAAGFNATVADLEQRVNAAIRFAGNFGHEVRTPLTTMANAAAVLHARRTELPPVAREALDLLTAQMSRFQRLVLDLLELSRITEGRPTPPPRVRLGDVVSQMAAAEGWTGVDTSGDALWVDADPRHLKHALLNLVRNAEEHGGGMVRLATCGRTGSARIEVDDAGPGVPEQEREHIFERFHRIPGIRAEGSMGFGVGLALVGEIAALYKGSVWVEDRPGGGARFVVELPLAES